MKAVPESCSGNTPYLSLIGLFWPWLRDDYLRESRLGGLRLQRNCQILYCRWDFCKYPRVTPLIITLLQLCYALELYITFKSNSRWNKQRGWSGQSPQPRILPSSDAFEDMKKQWRVCAFREKCIRYLKQEAISLRRSGWFGVSLELQTANSTLQVCGTQRTGQRCAFQRRLKQGDLMRRW